jgi:hypothetical protein
LYLMPLATLTSSLPVLLATAAVCAPIYALWVVVDYRRVIRGLRQPAKESSASGAVR